jgi:putative tricarboxylic transport membrane protein
VADGPGGGGDAPAIGAAPVEVAVSILLSAIGGLAIFDSLRLGAGWGSDGPQAGYFPFYLGLILIGSSLGILGQRLQASRAGDATFVTRGQLALVLRVLIPAAVFVVLILMLGIYVASALLILHFMFVLGGFRWRAALPFALGASFLAFVVFERWFLVPLPKGPLETWLGF